MDPDQYLTLASEGRAEIVAKGSRFLGLARPVGAVEEAMGMVDEAKAEWPHANHHAFAYRFRDAGGGILYRSSDDGEPGGTAGRPIYAVLDSQAVCNASVVVSRIFGGVKLGTGGLVRAYGGAARDAVRAAGFSTVRLLSTYDITIPLPLLGVVEAFLHRSGAAPESREMAPPDAVLRLRLPQSEVDGLKDELARITAGRARLWRRDGAAS